MWLKILLQKQVTPNAFASICKNNNLQGWLLEFRPNQRWD